MVELQIESVERPLLDTPEAVSLALRLVTRAQTMSLLPERNGERIELDRGYLEDVARRLAREGIAVSGTTRLLQALAAGPESLTGALAETLAALDGSPWPEGEWGPARELLGDELLARLVQASGSSLRRYAGGERRTPDEVAWRLHAVARILAALIGSYNEYGTRRWFERPRNDLDGRTPRQLLERARSEDDPAVSQVVATAERLLGPGGAT